PVSSAPRPHPITKSLLRAARVRRHPSVLRARAIRCHDLTAIVDRGAARLVGGRVGPDFGRAIEWKQNSSVRFSDNLQSTYVTAVACSVIAGVNLEVIVSNVGLMSRHFSFPCPCTSVR